MHRLVLAIGLATLLLAAAARPEAVPSDDATTMSGADACAVAGDARGPGDSDQQWRNAHHAIAVVTESVWKSSPVHAGLGAARVARLFEIPRFVSSPDPPAASTPHYLLHTPLLI